MLVECINDTNWHDEVWKFINEFPIKGEIYTVIGRTHTTVGLGYVLEELNNPPLPCGTPVGFSAKRFKPLGEITEITEVLKGSETVTN